MVKSISSYEEDDLVMVDGKLWRMGKYMTKDNKQVDVSASKVAVKFDAGKPRMDLLPPEFLEAVAAVLTFGAIKYSGRNWEKGMDWGRCYAALQRHLNAWMKGEEFDEESGMSHLWHAGCCLAFLTTYEARGVGKDDRFE